MGRLDLFKDYFDRFPGSMIGQSLTLSYMNIDEEENPLATREVQESPPDKKDKFKNLFGDTFSG